MRNEVQHPMAEHQKADNHSCAAVMIDAGGQESGEHRPNHRHEETMRPRESGTACPLYACEAESNG